MRKKITTIVFFFFLFSLLLISCKQLQNKNADTENMFTREKGPDGKMTDLKGAMEYEFNMIKNPTTGTIPEGIFEAERAQAREILARQQMNSRIEAVNAYSFQGPNNLGGRTRTIAYDVRYDGVANRIILAGGVSGGVYKSTDDGATWVRKSPAGEHFACMSIAQDTRVGFRDTWYYCVGEGTGNSAGASGAGYSGNGVYKSTDNGETWSRLSASNTTALESFSVPEDYITKIIVDPTDGYVYAACAAAIRRSTDGGTTWATVLSGPLSFSSQFTDIVVSSTGRLYASFGGTNDSGVDGVWASAPGPTSGDVGSWTRIAGTGAGGSPAGWNAEPAYGRVVLAIAPSSENLLYALYYTSGSPVCPGAVVEADLFRWDDIGGTWTDLSATLPNEAGCLSGNDPFAVQGGYDLVVAVKPDDPLTIFIGGTNAYRSSDAGLTWTRIGGYASPASYALYASSHPDIHSFVFQPGSPLIMLCGNDGGIQRTTDCTAGSVSWSQINVGYRTYQYYYVDIDPRVANDKVIGGAQDNGSTRNIGGTGTSFEMVWGGDGVSVGLNDPAATGGTQYEYVGSQLGAINRRTSGTALGFSTAITPEYANTVTSAGLFVTLFKLDQDNSQILYYANDDTLYRTTSASTVTTTTWTKMTGVAASVGVANDITALAMTRGTYSPATASLFFGTSDGRVFRLDDPAGAAAGTAPEDIEDGDFPAGYISSIAVNPRNDDTVMVTLSNYGISGNVWWTGNANSANPTWTNVEDNLTLPSYRSCAIHVVPNSTEVQYYVGTSVGLYRKTGELPVVAGAANDWAQEGASTLGNAVVSSLALRPSDGNMLVGTHGYGMWKTALSLFVVPVELTEFKGTLQNNKTALLQWTTSAEYNSKHFELERSFDGVNFRKITTIAAAGNSTTTRQYSYVDREPLTEKNYYRLRTVDMDNQSKLSNIVLLQLTGAKQEIQVLGNPFTDNKLTIRFVKTPDAKGELRLNDMTGRLVARRVIGPGEQQIEFTIPGTAAGTYILQAILGNKTYTVKVLKE
ncbi:MAG: T9SS type A sorting domain-containing protein [Chitinophagaceae bacterium]|nr:T9SS type A sorting domain-containing protein [Chitinophagaceae bacterium]